MFGTNDLIGRLAILCLFLQVGGCGGMVIVNGYKINEARWQNDQRTILNRASFDMQCPAEQISLSVLSAEMGAARQVGAQGCEQQLTFVKLDLNDPWVVNSSRQAGAKR